MSVFTPTHASLDAIFAAQTSYVIPPYQRPYSWQALGKSDKTNQVNQMWDDLWRFFNAQESSREYFLGSMVIIKKGLRQYDVIDGQQRLTTLTLLFSAMRCFVKKHEHDGDPDVAEFCRRAATTLEERLFNTSGRQLLRDQKVKIERGPERYDFNSMLRRAIDCETPQLPAAQQDREIAERYFQNRDFFLEQMERAHDDGGFLEDGLFTSTQADRFNDYFTFLNTRVSLVLIETTDFDTAYTIFEILNNRGLPLNNRDLLRNYLIQEMADAKIADPAKLWLELEGDLTVPEDFIGRFVESRTGEKLRASAFNELRRIYRDSPAFAKTAVDTKVERLYRALRDDAVRYFLIAHPLDRGVDLRVRFQILFIRACGNERYGINLLMALFRHYDYRGGPDQAVSDFLRTFQRWLLYLLLAPRVRFSSERVYQATRHLRDGWPNKAQDELSLTDSQRNELSNWIGGEIEDPEVGRLLAATVVWENEIIHPVDVVEQELILASATLEHVIPQEPAEGSNWLRDFPDDFRRANTNRLGNFTLLTGRTNAAARNWDFAKKRAQYRSAKLPMTVELGTIDTITPDFIASRHQRFTEVVRHALGLS